MERAAIAGHEIGVRVAAVGRAAGAGFGTLWRALCSWRERMRQRSELAAMCQRELTDLGIPPGLAAYEAGRWPWQKMSPIWRVLDEVPLEVTPIEQSSSPSRCAQERTTPPANSVTARERK
jgi:uncharacterized protein YjiS (DUF1127 family)